MIGGIREHAPPFNTLKEAKKEIRLWGIRPTHRICLLQVSVDTIKVKANDKFTIHPDRFDYMEEAGIEESLVGVSATEKEKMDKFSKECDEGYSHIIPS